MQTPKRKPGSPSTFLFFLMHNVKQGGAHGTPSYPYKPQASACQSPFSAYPEPICARRGGHARLAA